MIYRKEIDGLRALAVLAVIMFHAGFEFFKGGYIGVDIFFSISGYLITSLILFDIKNNKFNIVYFFERRVRRIFPALFLVMFVSLIFGYFYLMPDEFKNLGQSLVATTLFSNNILLGITSGYWDLTSEFKPLLHTWSLGVEEQYYIIFPILLILFRLITKNFFIILLWLIVVLSLSFAYWLDNVSPKWAFYLLPSRAWEIGIGALTAFYLDKYNFLRQKNKYSNFLSILGLLLILYSIFTFDRDIKQINLFLPILGTVLIIIFIQPCSLVYQILASKLFIFIGLLSYSLYLWHQPFFAFFRVFCKNRPENFEYLYFFPIIFCFSYFTWKYVELPFRKNPNISRNFVFTFSVFISSMFIFTGLYLNNNYGMANRVFSSDILISEMDKRSYNERVFSYKRDKFSDKKLINILIIGNSFARDFANLTLENFDISRSEIIYRDDLPQCISSPFFDSISKLYEEADVIVFASGGDYDLNCIRSNIIYSQASGKKIFYIGTKNFGYNLNWLIRIAKSNRSNQFNTIENSFIDFDKEMAKLIPSSNYISLLSPTLFENKIPITDSYGRMLSTDRTHFTKYGAIYFGQKAVVGTAYGNLFKN